jgi:adenylate kinase family enzyme
MADSLKASTKGLEIVERARRQKGWNKAAEVWCDAALTSKATLKRFWGQQLIQRETFIRICNAVGLNSWEEIVESTPDSIQNPKSKIQNLEGFVLPEKLPPVRNWVGREPEIEALKAQLVDISTNAITAVCIVGLSGIGKTTLASQLVRQLQTENTPFVAAAWESLRSATGVAPGFDWIIDSLLFTLSLGEITPSVTVQEDYLKKTERLVMLLKDKPCLVVLDNIDIVLKAGQAEGTGYFADDCAEYAWLFKQLVETEHQSKVIFTSQESLAELPRLQTHTIYLTGLEQKAAVALLESFNLTATQEELAELAERYQGYPKALELVAALIRDDKEFQGHVGKFLCDRNWLLIRDIESLIDEEVFRLSHQERTCLRRISVYQTSEYPLSYGAIAAQMPEVSEYDLKEKIVLALKRRQLLDYNSHRASYQLHPLIQEKAYRVLCQNPEAFRTAHRQAYRYFLSIPLKPEAEWKDIQDIKPLLLANYHASMAEDWDEAEEAISGAYDYLCQ